MNRFIIHLILSCLSLCDGEVLGSQMIWYNKCSDYIHKYTHDTLHVYLL